jgi:hypothetical protein
MVDGGRWLIVMLPIRIGRVSVVTETREVNSYPRKETAWHLISLISLATVWDIINKKAIQFLTSGNCTKTLQLLDFFKFKS